ncbi:AHH domain-containing protein [Myxococcus sp. CA051A]|uniref:AHH domain-containing protein n=1 Tax=Myxococcus sp. CA051A TaxID=2741739 RepID=UPI00157A2FCD|nr:AHH domain-containing protein [Myxococcus sp. CA051A]NTX60430.1 AHH domain-containing protein [Myxococcus sp. CA051A]
MPVIVRGHRVRFETAGPNDGPRPAKLSPCRYCGKEGHAFATKPGWSSGSSAVLFNNILRGAEPQAHPWYSGRWSIAAHHLICSEVMAEDDEWTSICWMTGYDINHRRNGVILPMVLVVACELHVPVHRGNHAGGWASEKEMPYPDAVRELVEAYGEAALAGAYCSDPARFIADLNDLSRDILSRLAAGAWTITSDGRDYLAGGVGCAGVHSLQSKPRRPCPHGRRHGVRHGTTGNPLPRRTLQVGE